MKAINEALSAEFQAGLAETKSLYGDSGEVSRRIKDTLKVLPLETTKKFFDIQHAR